MNVILSAPNPEDPLDATVAEHWTVSLLFSILSCVDHSNPEFLRETSTKPSNVLLNGHEGVAFFPLAFQLLIILCVDSPLGVLRQHSQSATIRMMQFFSMTCTNDHNRFANVKQISVYQYGQIQYFCRFAASVECILCFQAS